MNETQELWVKHVKEVAPDWDDFLAQVAELIMEYEDKTGCIVGCNLDLHLPHDKRNKNLPGEFTCHEGVFNGERFITKVIVDPT